ncbi:MAG: response regulator [Verrucomicrobiota bacterium]
MNATLDTPVLAGSMPAPGKRKTAKILIVDDEPPVRRFIESTLRTVGYEQIIFGTSGSAVPSLAFNERPDLIIMDVMMPGGNGLKALRNLRHAKDTAAIPVIITSGFNVRTLEAESPDRTGYILAKPFSASQLLQQVAAILDA